MAVAIELTDGNVADAALQAAQMLTAGRLVCLHADEGDWALALASDADAAQRFWNLNETSPAALMFVDRAAAGDLIARPSRGLDRLLRGGFGPLLIRVSQQVIDASLLAQLPEATRQLVQRDDEVTFVPPGGLLTQQILQSVPGPLLVCQAHGGTLEAAYDMLITQPAAASPEPATVRVRGDRWEILTPGAYTDADFRRMMAQRIVFVCTGNTCRSPMAEAMFRTLLAERLQCQTGELLQHGYDVSSAGIAAMSGAPASPESVQLCAEQGVDLTRHASQPLTEAVLAQADRLYTMTAGHREAILARYPDLSERVQVLSRNGHDVTDPIGCGRAAYVQSYTEITENLRILVDELTR